MFKPCIFERCVAHVRLPHIGLASTVCGQDTHSQDTFVQYSLFTGRTAQLMRLAQELHCHLCAPEKNLPSGMFRVSPFVVFSHLPFTTGTSSSSFTPFYHDTRTRTAIGTTRSTPRTPSTSCTSSRSPRSAIKNHSGVKTCRVVENRARQLP